MKQTISKFAVLAAMAVLSLPAFAGTITVTTTSDSPSINDAREGSILIFPTGVEGRNPTPGQCSLREAMHVAGGGAVAATVEDCVDGNGNPRAGVYCPFHGGNNTKAGECAPATGTTVDGPSADTINFSNDARGVLALQLPLPDIKFPVTITGLGPDQTIITGNAEALAETFAVAANQAMPQFAELAILKVHPDLPSGAEVKIENLTVRGLRVHSFLSAANAQTCTGAGCNAAPAAQRVINFSGIYLQNGVSPERKKLTLNNARFQCNRRGLDPAGLLPIGGGAISLLGRATLNANTVTFSNNISEFGSGGAIFAGAQDNGSPELNVSGSRFDAEGACVDAVRAYYPNGVADSVACPATGNTPCPPANALGYYSVYTPGNMAGAALADGIRPALSDIDRANTSAGVRIGGSFIPEYDQGDDVAASLGGHGGAIAVDALNATPTNIGSVNITGTRFQGNSARGSGGALSLAHVAAANAATAAINISNTLFTSPGSSDVNNNRAMGDGGAVAIIGNANQSTAAVLDKTSFSFNHSNNNGGALHYRTQPGQPINFSLKNVRVSRNSANGDGGAIYAVDNTVDDSGILNIRQATFDNNQATNGGAIWCGATKAGSQFTNLTFSGNVADNNGGALFVAGRCHVAINNNTIVDNRALRTATAGCTGLGCSGGGGIFVDRSSPNGRVDVRNSIIAGNLAFFDIVSQSDPIPANRQYPYHTPSGGDCSAQDNAVIRSAGFNFIGSNWGCGPAGGPGDASTVLGAQPFSSGTSSDGTRCQNIIGDIVGNRRGPVLCDGSTTPLTRLPLDPQLRVLADNGGPDIQGAHNFTHLPELSSPAINGGPVAGCFEGPVTTGTTGALITVDERELSRSLSSGRCDIGAVEVGGSNTPTVGNVTVNSVVDIPTSVVLANGPDEVEMLRLNVTASTAQDAVVTSLVIRRNEVLSGVPGSYASVLGLRVVVVDANGQATSAPLYEANGSPAFGGSDGVTLTIPLSSPLVIPAGESRLVSVQFLFNASVTRVASADNAVLMASAGGLGILSFVGLIGFGINRRRSLMVAALVAGAALLGGCSSDDDDGGFDGGVNGGARTFQISATQVIYSTAAENNRNAQINSGIGPTVSIANPN